MVSLINWIKRCVLLLVFLLLGIIGSLIAIVWMALAILFSPYGQRAWHIAIALDQLFNAAIGGSEDETISSRAGRECIIDTRWACVLCRVLDWMKKDHCKDSVGV